MKLRDFKWPSASDWDSPPPQASWFLGGSGVGPSHASRGGRVFSLARLHCTGPGMTAMLSSFL